MYPVSQVTGKSVLPLGHIGLKSMLDRSGINFQPPNNEKVINFAKLFCKPLTDTAAKETYVQLLYMIPAAVD